MVQYLIICQIGNRLDSVSLQGCAALHEGFQHTGERFRIQRDLSCFEHITCDRHKPVRCTGQIHFQAILSIVDVVHRLVIRKVRCQPEKAAEALS